MTPTTEELTHAVETTTWDIKAECGEGGCHAIINGSFIFRDGMVCFESSDPDYELYVTDLEDYEEGHKPSDDDVEAVRAHVEKAVKDKLERETELEIDSVEDAARDEAYMRKVGVHAYHGVSKSDFL